MPIFAYRIATDEYPVLVVAADIATAAVEASRVWRGPDRVVEVREATLEEATDFMAAYAATLRQAYAPRDDVPSQDDEAAYA